MLKDLIATPGETAASRITKQFRCDAHRQIYDAIRSAVDDAAERAFQRGRSAGKEEAAARLGCRRVDL